ncbi:MAG: hypothetical protein PHE61_08795, partial [Candidatus Omnitrophica bacterium]|nr:hypothetical protein [Candidatus Omnitrophota bacterium]
MAGRIDADVKDRSNTGVYIMTTNGTLAKRDAAAAAAILGVLGIKVGYVADEGRTAFVYNKEKGEFEEADPKEAWKQADIVYGSKSSFVFTLENELSTSRLVNDMALRTRQWVVAIDEIDKPLVEEIAEEHLISSSTPRADWSEILKIQTRVDKVARGWYERNAIGMLYERDGENIKITSAGEKRLQAMFGDFDDVKDMKDSDRAIAFARYRYYLKVALQAYAVHVAPDQESYTIGFNKENKKDILITDKSSGELKIGQEWTDLHNALRIKHNIKPRPQTNSLISLSMPALLAKQDGRRTVLTAQDGSNLIKGFTGASATIPKEPIEKIYGKQVESFASEADAERVRELRDKGVGAVLFASNADDANRLLDELMGAMEYHPLGKGKQILSGINVTIHKCDTAAEVKAVVGFAAEKNPKTGKRQVVIVVAPNNDLAEALSEAAEETSKKKEIELVGRISYKPLIWRSRESKMRAAVKAIVDHYLKGRTIMDDGSLAGEALRSVISRVDSIEMRKEVIEKIEAELAKRLVLESGVDGKEAARIASELAKRDIVVIDCGATTTVAQVEDKIKEVTAAPGKIAIVNNILNRGIDTRLNREIRDQGRWITGVTISFDKFIAEQVQHEGRFARAGDAGEWMMYVSVDDLYEFTTQGTEARTVLDALRSGAETEPLDTKKCMEVFDAIRSAYMSRYVKQAEEQRAFEDLLFLTNPDIKTGNEETSVSGKREAVRKTLIRNTHGTSEFIEKYLDGTMAGTKATRRDLLAAKAFRVAAAVNAAKDAEKQGILLAFLKNEFSFEIDLNVEGVQDDINRFLAQIEKEGSIAVVRYMTQQLIEDSLQVEERISSDCYTRRQDLRKYLAELGWEREATQFNPIQQLAASNLREFTKAINGIDNTIAAALDARLEKKATAAVIQPEVKTPPASVTAARNKRLAVELSLLVAAIAGASWFLGFIGLFGVVTAFFLALAVFYPLWTNKPSQLPLTLSIVACGSI